MRARRPLLATLAATLGLSGLGLGLWASEVFGPVTDVRVVNRSGAALTGLRVCIHECTERAELAAGRTWRVPLSIRNDGGAELTFDGLRDERLAGSYVTPGMGVRWVVRPGGQLELKQ